MSEEIWGDPLVFRPERFLDSNMKIINDDKLFAFGGGNEPISASAYLSDKYLSELWVQLKVRQKSCRQFLF